MQKYHTARCDDHDVISARTGPDATFNKKSSPLSSLTFKRDDLNRHFRFRTHPILDPILTHPVLKSGGFTRIRVGRCKIGSKIGWGDPIFHPILDPILLLKPYCSCTVRRTVHVQLLVTPSPFSATLYCMTSEPRSHVTPARDAIVPPLRIQTRRRPPWRLTLVGVRACEA